MGYSRFEYGGLVPRTVRYPPSASRTASYLFGEILPWKCGVPVLPVIL